MSRKTAKPWRGWWNLTGRYITSNESSNMNRLPGLSFYMPKNCAWDDLSFWDKVTIKREWVAYMCKYAGNIWFSQDKYRHRD